MVPRCQSADHPCQRRSVRGALHRHPDLRPDRNHDRSRSRRRNRLAGRRADRRGVFNIPRHMHGHERRRRDCLGQLSPPSVEKAYVNARVTRNLRRRRSGFAQRRDARDFSAALQRRRRSTEVMTSIRFFATWITSGYPPVLSPCHKVTRRRMPDAYVRSPSLFDDLPPAR